MEGRLVRLGDGWLLVSNTQFLGEPQYQVLDHMLELIETSSTEFWMQVLAVNGSTALVLTQRMDDEPPESLMLLRFNADLTVSEFKVGSYPMAWALSPSGRILLSPRTGGIHELSDGGRRVSSAGLPVAASGDRILAVECTETLGA